MSNYAIYFDLNNNNTYRLPTNPEELEVSSTQAIETYEVLKLGQVAIPTYMELREFTFECEFPSRAYSYIEAPNEFRDPDYYLDLFVNWRDKLIPVRFIASNGIGKDINTLVLIEELSVTEKAGEEGDKYINFKLLEYKPYGKLSVVKKVDKETAKVEKAVAQKPKVNPKNNGSHVVKKGDTLWAISKKYYGNGAQYPKIFNANKGKIKNPNLIYPGQKLVIP